LQEDKANVENDEDLKTDEDMKEEEHEEIKTLKENNNQNF
jgi:hypothetical protein